MKKNSVAVLLSSYNGEKYINEQIQSIFRQKDVDVFLFVRDDGSTDGTISILDKLKEKYKMKIYCEKNIGYAKSFWRLMNYADNFDYYCFCDQDDIWLEDKLSAAINKIEQEKSSNGEPILYTSRVIAVNNNKEIISDNVFNTCRPLNVYESFQKSKFPGCVFVFNKSAKNILIKYNGYMESHDWAAYCIISVFGKTIYDNNSFIYYRIHENNTIGKKNIFFEIYNKINRFFHRSKCSRSRFAIDFCKYYKDDIPSIYLHDIYQLAYYKLLMKKKIGLLFNKKFKGFVFKLYVLLNKV